MRHMPARERLDLMPVFRNHSYSQRPPVEECPSTDESTWMHSPCGVSTTSGGIYRVRITHGQNGRTRNRLGALSEQPSPTEPWTDSD